MHILLTDRLTCPRCGPEFGLILLADRVEDRRVHEGTLGCPNCRDRFPVTEGFGDLRAPPRPELTAPDDAGPAASSDIGEEAVRLGALLGVAEGPGHLALLGPVARLARPLTDLLEDVEVVAVWEGMRNEEERAGVSRIVAGPGLPFYSRTLRGVALPGSEAGRWLHEAARVVASMGRVVVDDAPEGTLGRLESAGLTPVLDESGVVVAAR